MTQRSWPPRIFSRRDYVQAYFWFSLDRKEGNAADAREHLSPAEIHGVERLRNEWKERHVLSPGPAAAIDVWKANSDKPVSQ